MIEEREDLFKQISRNIEFSTTFTGDNKKKKRYFSNFLI